MLKWVCLVFLILDLLLFAFAGYRLMTVNEEDVRLIDSRVEVRRDNLQQALRSSIERTSRAGDDEYWQRFEMEDIDYEPLTEEEQDDPSRAFESSDPQEAPTRAEQSPALNVERFGVSKTSTRLSQIERSQEAKDEAAQEATE